MLNMLQELLKIFGNRTRSLDILYLLEDLKPAVRLDANDYELEFIQDFCQKNSIRMEVSDFRIKKTLDEGKGNFANMVIKVPSDGNFGGLRHLYLSKDGTIAKFLKSSENWNNDKVVGKILGYPECCIDFFIKNQESQKRVQNDFILPIIENSQGNSFPWLNNIAARYFDLTLLSHFPHSFHCTASLKIAERNLACINKYSVMLAGFIKEELKNPVLYTERQGIYMFKECSYNDGFLNFKGINATQKGILWGLLSKKRELKIVHNQYILVDGSRIQDSGIMLFE
jgi:hypothetical protein